MPQTLIRLTEDELRVAVSRYVAEETNIKVIPRTVNFEVDAGRVTGAYYDIVSTPPDVVASYEDSVRAHVRTRHQWEC